MSRFAILALRPPLRTCLEERPCIGKPMSGGRVHHSRPGEAGGLGRGVAAHSEAQQVFGIRGHRETRMRSLSHSHRRSGGARKRRRAAAKVERVRTGLYVPLACEHPLGTLVRFSFCIFAALLCSSRGSNHSYPDMLRYAIWVARLTHPKACNRG